MTILQVIPGLHQASGPTAFCVNICDQMADDHTRLIILHEGRIEPTSCVPKNPRVRLVGSWEEALRSGQPDLVHVHALWAPFSHDGVRQACRQKIPFLISPHGMLAPWAMRHKWWKKRFAWWLYQKRDLDGAALLHATAESEIKWFRDLGFRQPCVLAPLGTQLPRLLQSGPKEQKQLRTVLFVGRIYPVKGLMNLMKAWALLKERVNGEQSAVNGKAKRHPLPVYDSRLTVNGLPWQLVIAGPDQAGHKAELLAESKRFGLTVANDAPNQLIIQPPNQQSFSDVVFAGPVYGEAKDALYRLADLFVLPSFTENFGAVVVDALAYGVPVITTKGTPWSELLGSGESGNGEQLTVNGKQLAVNRKQLVSDPPDVGTCQQVTDTPLQVTDYAANGRCGYWVDIGVNPLAEALCEAMGLTDEERRVMGENGQRLVAAKYTWPAVAADLRRAYKWVLSGDTEKPPCVWGI